MGNRKGQRKKKREAEKEVNYFLEFRKILNHFFKGLVSELKQVNDPRNQSYITHPPDLIFLVLIMKNATGLKSMRQMNDAFNTDEAIENMGSFIDIKNLAELPHYDTINNLLERLDVQELTEVRYYMIRELIKKRSFDVYRLGINGKFYWTIAIDGTGLYSCFKERHCEHCLKKETKDKKTGEVVSVIYYHQVLEAKLVLGDMVISIATEFIENENEDVKKQDCELKAFYRLAEKLKEAFPRLKICLLADSLYACGPVFEVCESNDWEYIFRFKDGSIPSVANKYKELKKLSPENQKTNGQWQMQWVNEIDYQGRELNVCDLEILSKESDKQSKKFVFLTSFKLNQKNIERVVKIGRSRWRIENEGFNRQKNHRLYIEHINSHNYTAMKNHYLIAQITEIIFALYEKGSGCFCILEKTIKEKSSNLLEAFRLKALTDEDLKCLEIPIQVRFT